MTHESTTQAWLKVCDALALTLCDHSAAPVSPIDGQALPRPACQPVTGEHAITAHWAETPLLDRQRHLSAFAATLRHGSPELAVALCLESGDSLTQCQRIVSAAIDHFDHAALLLRLPSQSDATDWVARGWVDVTGHPTQSLADDTASLASALACGCACRWSAPDGRMAVAGIILQLWQRCFAAEALPGLLLTLSEHATPVTPDTGQTRAWITPSAPIEQAVDDIIAGACWQQGRGRHSIKHVMVDHALGWEIEHRLRAALDAIATSDARDAGCVWPAHTPPLTLSRITNSDERCSNTPTGTVCLQAVSELPVLGADTVALCVYTCDQRDIAHVSRPSISGAAQLCINGMPSQYLSLREQAWHPWLQPRQRTEEADPPW